MTPPSFPRMAVRSSPHEMQVPESSSGHEWIDAGSRITRSEARHILGVTPNQFDRIAQWDAAFPKPLHGEDADGTYSVSEIHAYRDRIAAVLAAISNGPQTNGTIVTSGEQPVFTVPAMAAHLNVAPKTIDRWTRFDPPLQGAIGASRGKIIKVLTENHLRTFAEAHPNTVTYARSFSRLTDIERETIISHALALSKGKLEFSELIHKLSEQSGRSVETIRTILRTFMRDHPESLLQTNKTPSDEQKALCLNLTSVENDEFARVKPRSKREREILGAPPCDGKTHRQQRSTEPKKEEAHPYLQHLYEVPLLTFDQEQYLFRKMNFLKYRAQGLQERLQQVTASEKSVKQRNDLTQTILALYRQVEEVRNAIITANLRLVVNIAKHYMQQGLLLGDLVSDGNQSLMRAVEGFDYARGFKFSTYATWAIQKNFSRTIPHERKQKGKVFDPTKDGILPEPVDTRAHPQLAEAVDRNARQDVEKLLASLDEREREIIGLRFGLGVPVHGISADEIGKPHKLKEVGVLFGVTKERIRQLESRAMEKLRRATNTLGIELDGE